MFDHSCPHKFARVPQEGDRVQGCESVCRGVVGIPLFEKSLLASWFQSVLVVGVLVSWFQSFLVPWVQRFLVSKFQRFLASWLKNVKVHWFQSCKIYLMCCWKILVPYYHVSISCFQEDIGPISKISRIY